HGTPHPNGSVRAYDAGGVGGRGSRRGRGRRRGAADRARRGLLRRGQPRRGPRGAGARAARGRRPRDPAPADRGRLSPALPEPAAAHWRAPMDAARLRAYGRAWTATAVGHTIPLLGAAALLLYLNPLTFPIAAILVAHAWAIPELYA